MRTGQPENHSLTSPHRLTAGRTPQAPPPYRNPLDSSRTPDELRRPRWRQSSTVNEIVWPIVVQCVHWSNNGLVRRMANLTHDSIAASAGLNRRITTVGQDRWSRQGLSGEIVLSQLVGLEQAATLRLAERGSKRWPPRSSPRLRRRSCPGLVSSLGYPSGEMRPPPQPAFLAFGLSGILALTKDNC